MSLLTSLVAYWKLDEASGDALDAVGSETLTDYLGVGTGTGKVATARHFTRASSQQFYRSSDSVTQTGDIDFTWSAWVYFDSQPGTETIIGKGSVSGAGEYALCLSGGSFFWQVNGAAGQASVATSPTNGTWYFIVAWHDSVNNEVGIAINAGSATTSAYSGGVTTDSNQFNIGNDQSGSRAMDGLIDEVGFWKRVLTSQERTDLYNGGNGLAYPFTVASATTSKLSILSGTKLNVLASTKLTLVAA